jgi:hypothetical protein
MSTAYAGEGKTDAKDAYVIAETARIRTDLAVVDTDTDVVRTLGVLTGHRADLVADRVRMINRLRDLLTSVFPALEREFDFASCKGALVLLTGYATPEAIRRMGEARLSRWLRTSAPMRSSRSCVSRSLVSTSGSRTPVSGSVDRTRPASGNCADGSATCAAARGPAPPIARQIATSPVVQIRIVTLAPIVLPEKFSRMWKKR